MLTATNTYGVDLGSDAAKIYSLRRDRITNEKNMIAVRDGRSVIAVGNQAYEMYEKNPPNIDVDAPVVNGIVADADRGSFVLKKLLLRADAKTGPAPKIFFSVPLDMSRIERRAFAEVGRFAGIRRGQIFFVDQPICDVLACGITPEKTKGTMVVSIGADVTSVSVVEHGSLMISRRYMRGGRLIDETLCEIVRKQTNVLIGKRTANRLKHAMAQCFPGGDARRCIGMDPLSGEPREVVVSAAMVDLAVKETVDFAADEMKSILERIPPQVSGYIRAEGVYLTGGTARIPDLAEYMQERSGVRINPVSSCEFSTITGLRELIAHKALLGYARPVRANEV